MSRYYPNPNPTPKVPWWITAAIVGVSLSVIALLAWLDWQVYFAAHPFAPWWSFFIGR